MNDLLLHDVMQSGEFARAVDTHAVQTLNKVLRVAGRFRHRLRDDVVVIQRAVIP